MRVSVIAATYNQEPELELSLRSLALQSDPDFELIVTDDGSGPATREILDRYRPHFRHGLKHLWQEDHGFRKSRILNEAIRQATGDWLVFMDCDTIVHPDFVSDHRMVAAPNRVWMGRRVDLGPRISAWVRKHPERILSREFYARILWSGWVLKDTMNPQRSFRIGPKGRGLLAQVRSASVAEVPDLLGSNFSVHSELIRRVNGFDEDMVHYWGEDGDLFVRIRNSGAEVVGRKNFAVQWHLWHTRRQPQPGAVELYQSRVQDRTYQFCPNGLLRGQGFVDQL